MKVRQNRQLNAAATDDTEDARQYGERTVPQWNVTKIMNEGIQREAKKHGWKKGAK